MPEPAMRFRGDRELLANPDANYRMLQRLAEDAAEQNLVEESIGYAIASGLYLIARCLDGIAQEIIDK